RLPFLLVSHYAKVNFVDHTTTDQSSVLRFIEDNWSLGRIGDQSFDALAGSLMNMFDFNNDYLHAEKLLLDPSSGQPQ
ncbi:MAG: phospholipase, partial [Acidobacteriota bacterium]|nr:phospholipase [Acidobacteriota bacterium]